MSSFEGLGRLLLLLGLVIAVSGGLLILLDRLPFLARLPGNIHLEGRNWSCWMPLGASIFLSIVLTLLLNLVIRLLQR